MKPVALLFVYPKKWKDIHRLSISFLHILTNIIPFWTSLFPTHIPDFHMYKYYVFFLFIFDVDHF